MKTIFIRNSDKVILVDDEDFAFLSKFVWKTIKKRNAATPYSTHFGILVRPHRIILNVTDSSIIIDHKNGDVFDNRKNNLRICTHKENSRNIPKRRGNYTSKYKGVNLTASGKWVARITTDNGRKGLGVFATELEAAEAYNNAAIKYHAEFANFTEIKNG